MSYIGPTLPPHLQSENNEIQGNSSDSESDIYGPALPPHLKTQHNKNLENTTTEFHIQNTEDSSDDDIVIGPLPANITDKEDNRLYDIEKRSAVMKRKLMGIDSDETNKQPKREDWMIELPELNRKNFGLGPRTFNQSEKPECTGRDQWTSVAGSKSSSSKNKDDDFLLQSKLHFEEKRNHDLEKIVAKHNKSKRSESLLQAHQKKLQYKKDNVSSAIERKPFNRDEDLKLNQLDDAKRKALIKRSKELNSKFKSGNQKFL